MPVQRRRRSPWFMIIPTVACGAAIGALARAGYQHLQGHWVELAAGSVQAFASTMVLMPLVTLLAARAIFAVHRRAAGEAEAIGFQRPTSPPTVTAQLTPWIGFAGGMAAPLVLPLLVLGWMALFALVGAFVGLPVLRRRWPGLAARLEDPWGWGIADFGGWGHAGYQGGMAAGVSVLHGLDRLAAVDLRPPPVPPKPVQPVPADPPRPNGPLARRIAALGRRRTPAVEPESNAAVDPDSTAFARQVYLYCVPAAALGVMVGFSFTSPGEDATPLFLSGVLVGMVVGTLSAAAFDSGLGRILEAAGIAPSGDRRAKGMLAVAMGVALVVPGLLVALPATVPLMPGIAAACLLIPTFLFAAWLGLRSIRERLGR